uniref:Ppx/GppA phosphatase family protein n=3 Tax=Coprococcus sp. TaxID=2049024 RepID=UPI003FEF832B
MAGKTFAAINVGSNEISMKICEITPRKGARELDTVKTIIELGSDTYNKGYIEENNLNKLCDTLLKFRRKMKEYDVSDYRAYASSAVREAENASMIIERIKMCTDFDVQILSNSEQRFMNYKAFVATGMDVDVATHKNNALLDIGAGSLQISIFDRRNLVQTQNLPIGAVRIRDYMTRFGSDTVDLETLMEEYASNAIIEFRNLFLNDKDIKSIIAIGDGINNLKKVGPELSITNSISREQFRILYKRVVDIKPEDLAERYGIPYERATLMLPMAIIYQSFLDNSRAEEILTPNVIFCDGIIADYMDKQGTFLMDKNFDQDILASVNTIAKKYKVNRAHVQNVSDNALAIFDSIRKLHGLGKRERLQLQIAAILHNCGKFVNMKDVSLISYHIVMATEILGLSHKEREEIANAVYYNGFYLPSELRASGRIGSADYMKVAKLTAILRLADVLDKSYKQKITNLRISLHDNTLVIYTDTLEDITLEAGMFKTNNILFEKVYGVKAVLKQRRGI